jgi:hypothetical protein
VRSSQTLLAAAAAVVALAACSTPPPAAGTPATTAPATTAPATTAPATTAPATTAPASSRAAPTTRALAAPSKVMVIVEENKTYSEIIGSANAPYLNQLAGRYGLATSYDADYPPSCPSLGAYLLLMAGSRFGICDDAGPGSHPISADNVLHQVATSGRQWRGYADSMPAPCFRSNSGRYLVRHAPAPYFTDEAGKCPSWDIPLGTASAGPLHDDVTAGRLPAYSFVTPDGCHDMHDSDCGGNAVAVGDTWLRGLLPTVLAGPDFTAGRLAVFITVDEGDSASNHVATLVLSAGTTAVRGTTRYTHCSLLRTTEEILGSPLLGCAASAASMRAEFHL